MRLPDVSRSALLLIVAPLVLALVLGGCGGSTAQKAKPTQRGATTDIGGVPEEEVFKEIDVPFPPYPKDADYLKFLPRQNSQNQFYVDRNSISIAADRAIRYSVIVKSPSGALTTSFEGMRCKTAEYKVYAFGIKSGEWTNTPDAQWRRIPRAAWDFRYTLYKDYFCDLEAIAGRDEKDLIANLIGNPLNNVTDKNR